MDDNITPIGSQRKRAKVTISDIEEMARQGMTDQEIAKHYNVDRSTFQGWKEKKSDLREALERGRKNVIVQTGPERTIIDYQAVEEIAAKGYKKLAQIAALLRISASEFSKRRADDEEIDAAINRGHARFLEPVFLELQSAATGERDAPPIAAMFIAKVFGEWQDTQKVQVDTNVNVTQRVQFVLPQTLSAGEEFDQFAKIEYEKSKKSATKLIEMIETEGSFVPAGPAGEEDA